MKLSAYQEKIFSLECQIRRATADLPEGFSLYEGGGGQLLFNGHSIFIRCPFFDTENRQMHYGIPLELDWDEKRITQELAVAIEAAREDSKHPESVPVVA